MWKTWITPYFKRRSDIYLDRRGSYKCRHKQKRGGLVHTNYYRSSYSVTIVINLHYMQVRDYNFYYCMVVTVYQCCMIFYVYTI